MNVNKDILHNKSFCIYPWIHSNIHTTGAVKLCCADNTVDGMGYISKDKSWSDIWNSDKYKDVRIKMLNGEKIKNCKKCYEDEINTGTSFRITSNDSLGKKLFESIVTKTNEDGAVPMDIRYLDIRWSNICNLKCRMCYSTYSSLIATERKKHEGSSGLEFEGFSKDTTYISISQLRPNFLYEIIDHLENVETIYFAGGEPLLTEEHYTLLKILIDKKITNVDLTYNTNLTKLTYQKDNVVDLWKHFKSIDLRPSLDSWGKRAEYLRSETCWEDIEKNIQILMRDTKTISKIRPYITVSSYNVLTLPDFFNYMISKFNFTPDEIQFTVNVLDNPLQMNINGLSPNLRRASYKKLLEFKESFSEYLDVPFYNILLKHLKMPINNPPTKYQIKSFIDKYDGLRNTKFIETFPELEMWYNEQ